MRDAARAAAAATLLLLVAPPLLANGGTVRVSAARVGDYLVSVFSSPTPLRTGEVDISVFVQDTAERAVDVPVLVRAVPIAVEPPEGGPAATPIEHPATRAQADNKLFKAAKFDVATPGEWEFVVTVGDPAARRAGADAGSVSFRATLTNPTLLDHPYLLALLVLAPVGLAAWFLLGRDEDEADPIVR